MGISQFNRSNPMIILMRRVNDEFTTAAMRGTKGAIRRAIIQIIFQVILAGLIIIKVIMDPLRFNSSNLLILAVVFLLLICTIGFSFYAVVYCGKNGKMKEINDMIYGEAYQIADVNNEDVLRVIGNLEFMMGRLDATATLMLYLHGLTIATQCLIIAYLIGL